MTRCFTRCAVVDVTVIIVSWNTAGMLKDCLASVYREAGDALVEVIVVDNASTDGSAEMVEREFPSVTLMRNSVNRGFAAANNQGMRVAAGRYVLLLNSDTVALDRAVERMMRFADSRPEAGVVGCRILNPDGTLQLSCFTFPCLTNVFLQATYLYKIFPGSRFFGRQDMTWWRRDDVREVEVVTGCCMLVRRQAIEDAGGMDESYFFTGEEADWCRRIRRSGWKLLFTPAAQIIHFGGASAAGLGWKADLLQSRGTVRLIRAHHGPGRALAAQALLWMFNATHMLAWLAVSCVPGERAAAARARAKSFLGVCLHWGVSDSVLSTTGPATYGEGDDSHGSGETEDSHVGVLLRRQRRIGGP